MMSTVQMVETLNSDLKKMEDDYNKNLQRLEQEYQEAIAKRLREFQSRIAPIVAEPKEKETSLSLAKEKEEKEEEEKEEEEKEEEEEESFIVEDDEDVLSYHEGNSDDDDAPPPPVHYNMKPTSKRRARIRVKRYTDREEDGDDEDGEDCADPDEVGPDKMAEQQWNTIKTLPYEKQRTNPWFKKRYLDHFEGVRANLGRQGNNDVGNLIWNNIQEEPLFWEFKEINPFYTTCSLCNSKKRCALQAKDTMNNRDYFFASCCGPLAEAWADFHSIRLIPGSALDLDEARDAVVTANSKKKNSNNKRRRR